MNESEKRDKWLKIRISEREKEVIDTKFRNSGMKNVSDFIRAMIFVGVIVKFSDDDRKQLLRDFSAMSNNINQIAGRANTTGKVYPEDIVQIKDGQVYIDGAALTDSPIKDKIRVAGLAEREIKLDKNEYFVLGDNVNNSEDSRYSNVGNVSKTEIIGKVVELRGKLG